MFSVYVFTDKGGSTPLVFSLQADGLTKREANRLAATLRQRDMKAAVYCGARVKSAF